MTVLVGILGANGRLGTTALAAVDNAPDLEAIVIDPRGDLAEIERADVLFDATVFAASGRIVEAALASNTPAVIGTSGWSAARIEALATSSESRLRFVPNFSLGSVLLTHFAAKLAPHFNAVEIVEAHHAAKVDSPSGTAVRTAEQVSAAGAFDAPGEGEPGRGVFVHGVPVHALRLPGVQARQDVIFGGDGETLTLRHDTLSGDSYRAGILMSVRNAGKQGVFVGIDDLLGLQ
ncbi:4-hydroxy-tetrahydrodipicolinate reductase [Humidisolicoccus flavus]|uniref:4-hydroxy-tetrahydrodipicolinate reductase n=1 Tax=Humidisolicoccus flavus TaxID=3111414 RepID=UPI003252A252